MRRSIATQLVLAAAMLSPVGANAGDLLTQARSLATSGHRPEALQLLAERLEQSPGDADARVLYGLVLSWDGRYDDARRQFQAVLAQQPDYGDALQGLINVELWSGHPDRAEQVAADALTRRQGDTALLLKQARALRAQSREREALAVLDRLLAIDPIDQQALATERSIKESMQQWSVGWSHTSDWFKGDVGTWNESQMSLKRATPLGSVIATFSRADRYDLHSNLAEISIYPHIRPGTYAYLGFGYSYDATLYPTYRLGAEIFQSLPHGMEGSAGYRRFRFGGITNMYTGSLGKYWGKWLFTGRFFLSPDALGTTHSLNISARRFFGEAGDYVDFHAGTGPSEFDPRSRRDLEALSASWGYIAFRKALARHWQWSGLVGLAVEERYFRVAVDHYTFETTLYYRF